MIDLSLFHDLRSSLNGVVCMGSLLEESELDGEQREVLKYMLLSAEKTLSLVDQLQKNEREARQGAPEDLSQGDLSQGDPDDRAVSRSDGRSDDRSAKKKESTPKPGFSVLVAEDDPVSRLYLTTLLRRQNWHIDEASDGQEALDLFALKRYELILMDVSMPGIDGIQAAREIRSRDSEVPILAITAHGEGELQENFIEAGMSDVLRKPIHDEFLLDKIKSLCSV